MRHLRKAGASTFAWWYSNYLNHCILWPKEAENWSLNKLYPTTTKALGLIWLAFLKKSTFFQTIQKYRFETTVVSIRKSTNPVLCSNQPKFGLTWWKIKTPWHSSPWYSKLASIGALKWGTVWTSISTGIENTHCQSWKFVVYEVNIKVLSFDCA